METTTTFLTEKEAMAIPAPTTKAFVEHFHQSDHYFGVRIMRPRQKDGRVTRTWLVRFYESNRDYRESLGRVGKLSFAAAKAKAAQLYVQSQEGPAGGVPTFREAFERYISRRKGRQYADETLAGYRKRFAYLEAIGWGARRIDRITEDDCESAFQYIQEIVKRNSRAGIELRPATVREGVEIPAVVRKKAVAREGVHTAIGVLAIAKIVFHYYAKKGVLKGNPCQQLIDDGVFNRQDARERLITAEQLPEFWRWLHTRPLPVVRDYILMELFTGFRRSIMGSLAWKNLRKGTDGKYYYVLERRAKGNKAKRTIPVLLADYLFKHVIEPRLASPSKHAEWILPSPKWRDRPLHDVRGSFEALARETRTPDRPEGIKISDHDFRRTLATITHQAVGELLAARLLTHKIDATIERLAMTGGYIITTPDDIKNGINKVAEYVLHIVNKPTEKAA
ncbi:MAG: site-specific integrase [Steroidobacteraceae bacterium]